MTKSYLETPSGTGGANFEILINEGPDNIFQKPNATQSMALISMTSSFAPNP